MTLPIYTTGTVSVAHLGTTVTGAGGMWSGINAREGDYFVRADGTAVITEVTDTSTLQITPWPGATVAGGVYAIQQNYVGRVVGVAAAEDVGVMLEKLHTDGLPFIVGPTETVPDPSYGDEGQMAFKPDTGEWWIKSGGVWVPSSGIGGGSTVRVSTTAPASAPDNSLFWESDTGVLYIRYNDGNSTQWVATGGNAGPAGPPGAKGDAGPAGPAGATGSGSGDMLAANNLSELTATAPTARHNIAAAPLDALAYNGMQINGSFDVDQIFNGASAVISGASVKYEPFSVTALGAPSITAQIVADAPPGLTKSLKITVQTPTVVGTPAAGDLVDILWPIEGYRIARLAFGTGSAQPVSIGFWIKTHRPGMYSGAVINGPLSRGYPYTFTQNAADTWQFQTVTVPGNTDLTSTWPNANTAGMMLTFVMAAGSNYTGPANVWTTSGYASGANGTINGAQATTDVFQIAGVIVLPGTELPSPARAPLIMRPYNQEILIAKRYYEKSYDAAVIPGSISEVGDEYIYLSGTVAGGGAAARFKVTKGKTPQITLYSPATGAAGKVRDYAAGADVTGTADRIGTNGFRWYCTLVAGGSIAVGTHYIADARL